MLSSCGRPACSSPSWVVSWKITVPTVSSLLLQAEVEVARAVARGDGYLGLPGPDPLQVVTDVGRAADLDVIPELRARWQLAALQLLDAQAGWLPLEPVGEVGRGRRGAEGGHHDDEQAHEEPGVAPDPGPQAPLSVMFS